MHPLSKPYSSRSHHHLQTENNPFYSGQTDEENFDYYELRKFMWRVKLSV